MAQSSPAEGKVDVALIYDRESPEDERKATTLREALKKACLRVKSYDDLVPGRFKIDNRALLVTDTWSVVMIVTETFLKRKAPEMYMALQRSSDEGLHNTVLVKYTDMKNTPLCTYLKILDEIDGLALAPDEQVKRIVAAVNSLKQPDRSVSSNPLDGPADKMLKFTALKLTHFFAMDAELESLHKDLKGKVDRKCQGANPKQRLKKWENFINEKFDTWKNKRPKKEQHFDNKVSITSRWDNLTEDQMLQRLDGQKGYLYLAWLFFASSEMPSDDCTNLAECLDPGNIFELLKRCGVFPLWEDKDLEELQKLKDLRNTRAHDATASSPERQQKLIDEIKQKTKESFNKLVMWTFERGISQIVGEAGGTANQSNVGEDQQDNAAS